MGEELKEKTITGTQRDFLQKLSIFLVRFVLLVSSLIFGSRYSEFADFLKFKSKAETIYIFMEFFQTLGIGFFSKASNSNLIIN